MTPRQKLAWFLLLAIGLAIAGCTSTGCKTPAPAPWPEPGSNSIPRFSSVEPSVYRGGQPSLAGWAYLRSLGVSNIIKLNPTSEAGDQEARNLGMVVRYHPIDTMAQLVGPVDGADAWLAESEIGPGTFVHCLHGEDRTGLIVGLHRLREGTNAAAAWQEMLDHGYHPALNGLTRFWNEAATHR